MRGGRSAKEKSREGGEKGGTVGQTERKFDGSHVNELQWHMKQLHRKSTCNSGMHTHTHAQLSLFTSPSSPSPCTHNKWTVRAVKCRKCISKTRLPNSQNICETFRLCGQFCRAAWAWLHIHFELGVNAKGKGGRRGCWLRADKSLASSGKLLV